MRRALPAALVLAACCHVGVAVAQTATLTPVKPPAVYHPAGHAVDVLGIAPGMMTDAVKAILVQQYGAVQVTEDHLGLDDRGVTVSTQSFVTRMQARKGADEIDIWFGTPTTGNAVVEVTRQLSYIAATEPLGLRQARGRLITKYGQPGFDGSASGTGEISLLAWSFQGDKPSACVASACRADLSEGLDVRNLANYARATRTGHELTIVATILADVTDPTRAASVVVTMSDAATKLASLDAAIDQMKAAVNARRTPAKKAAASH